MKNPDPDKKFRRNIIISFILVFIFSFSYKLGGFYYELISAGSLIGLIGTIILQAWGLFIFPLAIIFIQVIDRSITFLPLNFSTLYFLVASLSLGIILILKKEKIKKDYLTFSVLFFIFIAFLTTIINGYLPWFGNWEFTHYLSGVLTFFILSVLISTKKRLRIFCWMFALFMVSLSFRLFNHVYSFNSAVQGLSGDNNHLARIFSFAIFFVIGLFWAEKDKYLKGFLLIILAFIAQGIIQLGSRATFIAVGIGGVFLAIKNIRKKNVWVLGFLSLILISVFAPPIFFEEAKTITQVKEGRESSEGSIRGRTTVFFLGIEIFKEKIFTGYGIQPFGFIRAVRLKYDPDHIRKAHNSFLVVAVETGIFGLLSYLFIYLFSFYLLYKSNKMSKNKDIFIFELSNACIFGVVAIFINNFTLDQPWAMIFIAAGLSSALYYLANNLEKENKVKAKKKEKSSEKF